MEFRLLKKLDEKYIASTYKRGNLMVREGNGARCEGETGQSPLPFIDFSAGIGVSSVGYRNPVWVEAVKAQLDKLAHMSNLYYTEPMALLAEKLCERTGMSKVFFSNSGAEANECAIKTARKYMSDNYPGSRDLILTLVNSFHGRTLATLSATGQEAMHKHFGPFLEGFVYCEANNIADLNDKLSDRVGAIFIECVQGEGGVIELEQDFADAIQKICAQRDILLMVDEVQTGIGRTGSFLSLEHYGISPDVVTLAKGLGGGLPIGAALFGKKTADTLGKGDHGSTFGGNPVCCAGACAVLDIINADFLDNVNRNGVNLRKRLLGLEGVKSVSGIGLMLGATLAPQLDNADIIASCAERGVIILAAKHKLRFLPPLTISRQEIDEGTGILKNVLLEALQKN